MEMVQLAKVLSTWEKLDQIGKMFAELDYELGEDVHVNKTRESIKYWDFAQAA